MSSSPPLIQAYRRFARQHPRWAASLFDEHFLRHQAAGLLHRRIVMGVAITPAELADAWVAQLAWPGAAADLTDLIAAAADFLHYLDEALGGPGPRRLAPAPTAAPAVDPGHVLAVYAEALREGSNRELDWLWLAKHLPQPADRRYCIERALQINPESALARRALKDLFAGRGGSARPSRQTALAAKE